MRGKSIGWKVGCRLRSERYPTCPFCMTIEPLRKWLSGAERKGRGEASKACFTSAIDCGFCVASSLTKSKSEGSKVVLCVAFLDLAVVCGLVFDFVCVLAVAFLGVLAFSSALTRSTSCVHSVYSSGAKSRYSWSLLLSTMGWWSSSK